MEYPTNLLLITTKACSCRFHYMNVYEEGSKLHMDFSHHKDPEMLNTLYLDVMRKGERAITKGPLRCGVMPLLVITCASLSRLLLGFPYPLRRFAMQPTRRAVEARR